MIEKKQTPQQLVVVDPPELSSVRQILKQYKTGFAASAASICSVIMGSPFDSIKVRMQTQRHQSTYDCIRKTYKVEGIRGFFRGILPPLVSVNVVKTISVSVYESTRKNMLILSADEPSAQRKALIYFLSGCLAGVSTSFISCPLEMIRNQRILFDYKVLTAQNNHSTIDYRHAPRSPTTLAYFQELRRIGIRDGIYRGYHLHLLRESFGTGVYWLTYECMHWLPYISTTGTREGASPFTHFMAGGLTGMVAWLAVFPVDLVKNIYQKQVFSEKRNTMTVRDCMRQTYQMSGGSFWGFYRGALPTMLRAFPIHGMNLLIYEYFLLLLDS